VELALTLPILVLIGLGVFDFAGRRAYNVLGAAREDGFAMSMAPVLKAGKAPSPRRIPIPW
jgi:hypothetical protein